jgi:hypothetical protein
MLADRQLTTKRKIRGEGDDKEKRDATMEKL